jgi:hypothetical protein
MGILLPDIKMCPVKINDHGTIFSMARHYNMTARWQAVK